MTQDPTSTDPRSIQSEASERDIRPIVDRPRGGLPSWAWVGAAMLTGLLLFGVLDARRRAATAPAVLVPTSDRAASAAPPPLYVPPPLAEPYTGFEPDLTVPSPAQTTTLSPERAQARYDRAPGYYEPPRAPEPSYPSPSEVRPPVEPAAEPQSTEEADPDRLAPDGSSGAGPARVRASVIANRTTTVLQGTLIPAVLETGFDSSRPGYARALVQRDIKGFDGRRILIPRGSRLIGEYSSEAGPAQKRAMIAWQRLIRPDGVTIAIGSPASDPVGRGGVRAKVNSHFLARFAGAILQSTLDIGVNLASRSADSPVIVALPGSLQGATSNVGRTRDIPPTLSVRPGTSISVFVARDLDFTDVETRP